MEQQKKQSVISKLEQARKQKTLEQPPKVHIVTIKDDSIVVSC